MTTSTATTPTADETLPDEEEPTPPVDDEVEVEVEGEDDDDDALSLKSIILKSIAVTVLLVGLLAVANYFFATPLREFALWVVEELGLLGIFLGVLAADALSFPISIDTYVLVAVASDTPLPVMVICTISSILGGNISYFLGPLLQKVPLLSTKLDQFRPRGEKLFARYGFWAIVIAALSPIPFCITCWVAGIYKMNYKKFFLGTLFRAPRLVIYYFLFELGMASAPPV